MKEPIIKNIFPIFLTVSCHLVNQRSELQLNFMYSLSNFLYSPWWDSVTKEPILLRQHPPPTKYTLNSTLNISVVSACLQTVLYEKHISYSDSITCHVFSLILCLQKDKKKSNNSADAVVAHISWLCWNISVNMTFRQCPVQDICIVMCKLKIKV